VTAAPWFLGLTIGVTGVRVWFEQLKVSLPSKSSLRHPGVVLSVVAEGRGDVAVRRTCGKSNVKEECEVGGKVI
jgi:hypothetical protein